MEDRESPQAARLQAFWRFQGEKRGVSNVAGRCGLVPGSNEIPTELVRTAVRKARFPAEKRPVWQCKIWAGSAMVVPESCRVPA